jgi:hypothetical protein
MPVSRTGSQGKCKQIETDRAPLIDRRFDHRALGWVRVQAELSAELATRRTAEGALAEVQRSRLRRQWGRQRRKTMETSRKAARAKTTTEPEYVEWWRPGWKDRFR